MNIIDIYHKYRIPANLQRHMLRVGAVGKLVVDSFSDDLDGALVVKTLLLHDMGNIIKFKFDDLSLLDVEDRVKVDEFVKLQAEFIKRFGSDCDLATEEIIREITNDEKIVDLCAHSHAEHMEEIINKDEWEKKIAYYCDMRVGPFGIVSVNQRFDDLDVRYGKSSERLKKLKRFREICLIIEEQLQENTSVDIVEICEDDVRMIVENLKVEKV